MMGQGKIIAVITGASSGMGKRFAETVYEYGKNFDEIWVIARRQDKLQEIQTPFPVRPISLDLTDMRSFEQYEALLNEEKPTVELLINASGFGKFQGTFETPLRENLNMVDLNCKAVMALCQITAPYMPAGGQIVNMASVAAYQPIPYINVYGATKSFVLNYSRALNCELRKRRISVTAVCPFWTKTEFFNRAIDAGTEAVVKKYVAMYQPEQIVRRAWRDVRKRKEVSKFGFTARFQVILANLLPHRFVMWYWMKQQGLE